MQVMHRTLAFFYNCVHVKRVHNFSKKVYNLFENIPLQNKDSAVVSVRKMCLINFS